MPRGPPVHAKFLSPTSHKLNSISMSNFPCTLCSGEFLAPSERLLLTHIRLAHSQDPDFSVQCSFSGCSRTFKNFRTYQNHRLKHSQVAGLIRDVSEEDDSAESDADNDVDDEISTPSSNEMQMYAAKWILKTRETRNITILELPCKVFWTMFKI